MNFTPTPSSSRPAVAALIACWLAPLPGARLGHACGATRAHEDHGANSNFGVKGTF